MKSIILLAIIVVFAGRVQAVINEDTQLSKDMPSVQDEDIKWKYCNGTDGTFISVTKIVALDPLRIKREINFQFTGNINQVGTIVKIIVKAYMGFYPIVDKTEVVQQTVVPMKLDQVVPIDMTDAIPGEYTVNIDNVAADGKRFCIEMNFTLRK